MRILIFTTALEHSTFRKTARMLERTGAVVHIIGFTRNNYPFKDDGLSSQSYGTLEHGNYFTRFMHLSRFMRKFRSTAHKYDVAYIFTLDTLLISYLSLLLMDKKLVYQVQDIRPILFGTSVKNRLARSLESFLLKRIELLVVSSYDFYEGFFKRNYKFPLEKVQVVENKLEESPNRVLGKHCDDKITFGYFGVLRCSRSFKILRTLMENNPEKLELYMRGKSIAVPDLELKIEENDNIIFEGYYRSPDDLPLLYNQVDIVWAAYPFSENYDGNWKYARTIRFYEACAYGKPVIVQKGTAQEKDVKQYNIGLVVDMSDIPETLDRLKSISKAELNEWRENIARLPETFYTHQDEYRQLLDRLK